MHTANHSSFGVSRIIHRLGQKTKAAYNNRAWWPALYLLQDACIKQGVYLTCRTPPPPGLLLTPEDYTGQRPWVPLDRVDLSPKSRSLRKKTPLGAQEETFFVETKRRR